MDRLTAHKVVVWWPPIGLVAMVALGLVVGKKSTPIDGWFTRAGHEHRWLHRLLYFTNEWVLLALLVVCVAVTLYRGQRRFAAVIVVTPIVAVVVERVLKQLFQRRWHGALAYPSGHTTLLVLMLGLAVIVAGAAAWTVAVAVVFALFGLLGLSVTFHYFTDTIGGVLLGTAVLCLAVRAAGLDRCQPRCDVGHSDG